LSYEKCMELNVLARPLWKDVFNKHFSQELKLYYNLEHDNIFQKTGNGDGIVLFRNFPGLTFELKTVRYNQYYAENKTIFIEEIGNLNSGNVGSGLENCQAELWCYGLVENENLRNYHIYWCDPFKRWFRENKESYRFSDRPNTDDLYNTGGRVVPISDLEFFEHKKGSTIWRS